MVQKGVKKGEDLAAEMPGVNPWRQRLALSARRVHCFRGEIVRVEICIAGEAVCGAVMCSWELFDSE